jgi:hypothetical protein
MRTCELYLISLNCCSHKRSIIRKITIEKYKYMLIIFMGLQNKMDAVNFKHYNPLVSDVGRAVKLSQLGENISMY